MIMVTLAVSELRILRNQPVHVFCARVYDGMCVQSITASVLQFSFCYGSCGLDFKISEFCFHQVHIPDKSPDLKDTVGCSDHSHSMYNLDGPTDGLTNV